MKQPKDKIFQLVQAMSPSEKRYFKRHYASTQSNLTQLFDYLNSLSVYDEELVKAHFADSKLSQNLKVYKVQLLNLILKSLVSCHSKSSPKSSIRIGLEEVNLLMEKQLYNHAANRLKKIKDEAIKYEEFTYLIEIAYIELRLQFVENDNVGISQNPIYGELERAFDKLTARIKLTLLGVEIMDARKRTTRIDPDFDYRKRFEKLIEEPFIKKSPEALSFNANLSRNITLSNYYFFIQDAEKEAEIKKNNIELFERFPHFKSYLTFEFLAVLLNYSNLCLENKNYEIVESTVAQAEHYAGDNITHRRQLIYFYYNLLKANFEQRQFKAITKDGLEENIIELIEHYKIPNERIALINYLYLTLTYLALGKNKKAQAYIRQMQQCNPATRAFFEEIIQIIELINHYETKDEIVLFNLVNSINRRIKKKQESPFFGAIVQFFSQLIKYPGEQSRLATEFFVQIDQFRDDKVHFLFYYLQLDNWLQALKCNRSFSQQIKKA